MTSELTVGKVRGLQRCANEFDCFSIMALDARGILRSAIAPDNPASLPWQRISEWKVDITRRVGRHASAVLLDPGYAVAPAIQAGAVARDQGLLVTLETSGYENRDDTDHIPPDSRYGEHRINLVAEGWGVEKIKRVGADAVKLLLQYNSAGTEAADYQMELVDETVRECARHDIALLLEPITYSIPGGPAKGSAEFAELKPGMVIDAAREVCRRGIDVLKAEFPDDTRHVTDRGRLAAHCQELTDAANGVPWVLLSAGVGYEQFRDQVTIACENGASGILVGRAVWQEAIVLEGDHLTEFIEGSAVPRLQELTNIVNEHAVPWTTVVAEKLRAMDTGQGWKLRYEAA